MMFCQVKKSKIFANKKNHLKLNCKFENNLNAMNIKNYVIRLVFIIIMVIAADRLLKGFHIESYTVAFWVALAMSILNTFVKPVLQFLAIPITILTLGFFYLVVNVIIVYIAAYMVTGFTISGFLTPLIFSFMVSVANSIANAVSSDK